MQQSRRAPINVEGPFPPEITYERSGAGMQVVHHLPPKSAQPPVSPARQVPTPLHTDTPERRPLLRSFWRWLYPHLRAIVAILLILVGCIGLMLGLIALLLAGVQR